MFCRAAWGVLRTSEPRGQRCPICQQSSGHTARLLTVQSSQLQGITAGHTPGQGHPSCSNTPLASHPQQRVTLRPDRRRLVPGVRSHVSPPLAAPSVGSSAYEHRSLVRTLWPLVATSCRAAVSNPRRWAEAAPAPLSPRGGKLSPAGGAGTTEAFRSTSCSGKVTIRFSPAHTESSFTAS